MARPMSKKNALFASAPRWVSGFAWVYAAHLSNGVVKVGFSCNPRTRMTTLSAFTRKHFASEIVAFQVSDMLPEGHARKAEDDLIRLVGGMGAVVPGHVEFFDRVHFPAAADLVRQVKAA